MKTATFAAEPAGTSIPGSKYFREYCFRCHEAIRVPKTAVGKVCLCQRCRVTSGGMPSRIYRDPLASASRRASSIREEKSSLERLLDSQEQS